MLLSEYQAQLAATIDRYSRTDLILSSQLAIDARAPSMGIVSGVLEFVDGTRLIFSEYLDVRYRPERLSYVFHFQDSSNTLIFRYDNAAHKPAMSAAGHKHTATGEVIITEPPEFSAILDEALERFCR